MKRQMDMLHGSIWDKMLRLALPLAASGILQQLFNAADVAVAGRFAGDGALAAVGANSPLINLLVNLFLGLSVGSNAVIAASVGAGDSARIKKAVHTSLITALTAGFTLLIAGQFTARFLLELLGTPSDIIDLAESYLKIYFLGMPFIMLYNFASAILRSKGDTSRPLLALAFSGVVNVALNLWFVIGWGMGVDGVAIATVLSNGISAAMLLYFLSREEGSFRLTRERPEFDWSVLGNIAGVGVPTGLQGVVFALSNVCIQSALNHLGSDYVAGSTAALNFEYLTYFMVSAFGQAALTFVAQNRGAGDPVRCKRASWCAFGLAEAITVVMNAGFLLPRSAAVSLFTADALIAACAVRRMELVLTFEPLNCAIEVLSGILRGYGHSTAPAVISMIGICGVRILFVWLLPDTERAYDILMTAYPVSWLVTTLALILFFLLYFSHHLANNS